MTPKSSFSPNKTLAEIDQQIAAEIAWIREWQEAYGSMLIDPETVTVSNRNARLKKLFADTKLDRRNTDHWKFLLAMVIETIYRQGKRGRKRGATEKSLAKEAEFVRELDESLKENPGITTATKLAAHLTSKKFKMMVQKSCENKISKVRKRIAKECKNPKLEPRLPISPQELCELTLRITSRLGRS